MKDVLTYSSLQTFRNCRRKFDYRYNRELVPLEKDTTLYLGSVWHDCLETWYRGLMNGQVLIDEIMDCIDRAYPDRLVDDKQKANWHLARAMFRSYILRYPNEPFEIIDVEKEFEVPIVNPATGAQSRTFKMRGKVDGLVSVENEGLFIMEHKTASVISADLIDRLPLDFQVHLYAQYLSRELGRPIVGIIYNVASKARLQQSKGETEDEYEARRAELIAKSKTGKTSAKRRFPESDDSFYERLMEKYHDPNMFHREKLYIAQEDLDSVKAEVWDLTQQILITRRRGHWGQNTSNCFSYNRPCPYFPLCRSHENPNLLDNAYVYEPANSELSDEESETPF